MMERWTSESSDVNSVLLVRKDISNRVNNPFTNLVWVGFRWNALRRESIPRVPAYLANISHDPPRLVAGGQARNFKSARQYQAPGTVSALVGRGEEKGVSAMSGRIGLMLMSESCQNSEASGFALTPTANS
jgi:hypothetical protein